MKEEKVTKADLDKEIKRRLKAKDSLLAFTEYTYPNWVTGEHHRKICAALERVERGEIDRLMIFAPPRHSKSELASKRFPSWYMGRHPDRQIICASYGDTLATDFGSDVRDIIRDPWYQNLFPGTTLRSDTKAAGRWRTEQGGIYIATGIGGAVTGRGAHIFIIDDPVKNREDADSLRKRDIVWRFYMGVANQRLMPGGAIILMMTRWHEDDLAARALEVDKWEVLKLEGIGNEHTDHETALWPEWFPLPSLQRIRKTMAEGGRLREWEAQYQQNPTPESGTYIKRKWYRERYNSLPSNLRVYMASDFALREPEEGQEPDYTEHGVFGVDSDSRIYPMAWWKGQTTADVWVDTLLNMVQLYRPACWFGEAGMIRRAVEPFLTKRCRERKIFFRQEWVSPISDKAARGRAFQGRSSAGMVIFPAGEEWAERVIEQVVSFPGAAKDDAFDVMALMCRVIDQAHEAIDLKPTTPDRPRDGYTKVIPFRQRRKWKTA